ncbi:MAG TPA: zinc-ribbon domain-containing protein [Stellaceae bacterium]|jgi:predicted Zn finger-like uncharacterized protein|nr:zinc-ribbon domain-containing protein [Stellaceae bacterium]
MIVACSKCEKRYVVDPRALGAAGRRVRCANCQHIWFETPPEETLSPIELPPLPDAPPVVRTTSPELGSARRIQLPAVKRPGTTMIWVRRGAIAAALAFAIWGLVAARQQVMSAAPFTGRLYSLVGLGPVLPGQGLEFRDVTPSRGVDDGTPTLAVNGQVANVSNSPKAVPKLRVVLRDGNNKELQSWTVSVTDAMLAPGSSVPFHTTISQPPDGATGVVVSFLPAGS